MLQIFLVSISCSSLLRKMNTCLKEWIERISRLVTVADKFLPHSEFLPLLVSDPVESAQIRSINFLPLMTLSMSVIVNAPGFSAAWLVCVSVESPQIWSITVLARMTLSASLIVYAPGFSATWLGAWDVAAESPATTTRSTTFLGLQFKNNNETRQAGPTFGED